MREEAKNGPPFQKPNAKGWGILVISFFNNKNSKYIFTLALPSRKTRKEFSWPTRPRGQGTQMRLRIYRPGHPPSLDDWVYSHAARSVSSASETSATARAPVADRLQSTTRPGDVTARNDSCVWV